LRLYETDGRAVKAQVKFDPEVVEPDSPVVETDLLERPLQSSTARMEGEVLRVWVPARGIVTVRIG